MLQSRSSALLLAAGSLTLAGLLSFNHPDATQEHGAPEAAPAQEQEAERAPTLHSVMENLADGIDALATGLEAEEPDLAAAAELAAGIRSSVVQSIELAPRMRGTDDALEQLNFRIGFQRRMVAMLDDVLELELALGTGNKDTALAQLEALFAYERPGHQEFKRRAEKSGQRW
ncbi:MAG: hypothetical protein ACYS26_14435 [Planctomycetota bacterium]|jgi:hypothetical protein